MIKIKFLASQIFKKKKEKKEIYFVKIKSPPASNFKNWEHGVTSWPVAH